MYVIHPHTSILCPLQKYTKLEHGTDIFASTENWLEITKSENLSETHYE